MCASDWRGLITLKPSVEETSVRGRAAGALMCEIDYSWLGLRTSVRPLNQFNSRSIRLHQQDHDRYKILRKENQVFCK